MFQDFRFGGQVIFENSTLIKSWSLKSMSLFYIDICFSSFVNKGHSVDTQFCTHDLIKENDMNDHPCTLKNHDCITCINFFLHYMHQLVFPLYALIHSLHIIKMILRFQRSQQCFWFPNQTVRSKDIACSSLHGQHALCLGKVDHA